MRIVFMGTPEFAVESLKILVENKYHVVGVITAPDKPAGRGQKLTFSAVKLYAESQHIPILQPTNLKDPDFLKELRKWKPDLQIVVAFRMLPEVVWAMPKYGTFNLHASLLPQYRGAAPINWAIINGEKETGVTTFMLDHKIDTGDLLLQEQVGVNEQDTAGDLHDRLMETGARLVLKTVEMIASGGIKKIPQHSVEKEMLKPAPKIFKEDCRIHWNKPAREIHNLIRGLSPYLAAWTELISDQTDEIITMKVFRSLITDEYTDAVPGTLLTDGKTYVKGVTAEGLISLIEVQMAGKKRMEVQDFLRGFQKITAYTFI